MELSAVREKIRFYRDFPKKGVVFIDLLPLLGDAELFTSLVKEITSHITCPTVAAPEARGFLFSSPLLTVGGGIESLIVFRKSGKLPYGEGDLVRIPIVKEYGEDSLYCRRSDLHAARVTGDEICITVFDDVLATGGTAEGMAHALNGMTVPAHDGRMLHVRVMEFVFLAEITDIGARRRLEKIAPVKSVLEF